MSAAADAEDRTEKHPVTPGVPTPARELYGTMLLERGMAKEALGAFEATLKKEPNRLGATLGAGAAAEKSGDSTRARQHYAAALALAAGLACAIVGYFAPAPPGPADKVSGDTSAVNPVWAEMKWPFSIDQW